MKRIIKWLNYCYYRSAKWYSSFGDPHFEIMGRSVVCLAIGCNILSFLFAIIKLLKITLPSKNAHIIILFSILLSCTLFSLIKKEYEKLAKEYEEEQNAYIRGKFVTFYIIGSVVFFFLVMLL